MKKNGYIAFTSILIVSAIALSVAVSIALTGVNEAKSSLTYKKGQETNKIAQSCVEEALIRLKEDISFTSGGLNLSDGSCTINVTGSASEKTITVVAQIDADPDYIKEITIEAEAVSGDVVIKNWQE